MANPIINLLVFNNAAEDNTKEMYQEIKNTIPTDSNVKNLILRFGNPNQKVISGNREIWVYNANPWWIYGWTLINIEVTDNIVNRYWLDD